MKTRRPPRSPFLILVPWLAAIGANGTAASCLAAGSSAPAATQEAPEASFYAVPDLAELARGGMRDVVARWSVDRSTLRRFHDVSLGARRGERLTAFARSWREALRGLDYDALPLAGQVDYLLLDTALRADLRTEEILARRFEAARELLPFAQEIAALQAARREFVAVAPERVAERFAALTEELEALGERARAGASQEQDTGAEAVAAIRVPADVALRASDWVAELRDELAEWYRFYDGYDPLFTWWVAEPYEALDGALEDYRSLLREEVVGIEEDDDDTIVGAPIGREALLAELEANWIPYSPEELIEIAEREFAWCAEQRLAAARELGFGDDWRAALEHVKSKHVAPGEQPALIHALALEAVDYLEANDLVSVPELAKRTWRMEMMSPERQRYTPYFTGGEVISVAFPTGDMEHAGKLMSMRGNNEHFARATVHHELIPGHHLQQFMLARHATHRRPFRTPFWGEGWALYWEMVLWDRGFQRSPEDRLGMLFWRMHRCARIVFSLRYQLGDWTPEECIDYLTGNVGHERANATAEVRRSVQGGYGPLYQCAYMLGGLQLRALHRELVGSGRMTGRELHDRILREGSIPIELLRALVSGVPLPRDARTSWRFYADD